MDGRSHLAAISGRHCYPGLLRMAFGAIMLWEMWRYSSYGWISRYWIEPSFHFTYFGFDWIRPWPGIGMYVHFWRDGPAGALHFAGAVVPAQRCAFLLGL
ncbi:MAG: HTTM domain-containing protein [Ardenticatenaceae bacterium]|nr:HTTM domain-containing protein [Ardenticatenaceae bacterium]